MIFRLEDFLGYQKICFIAEMCSKDRLFTNEFTVEIANTILNQVFIMTYINEPTNC